MHRDSNRVRCAFFLFYRPNETEVRPTGKYRYLTFEDRKKIEAWHLIGDRPADIAARLSVHYTTIYKELQRGALSEEEQESAIKKGIQAIEKVCGVTPKGFRSPEGELTLDTLRIAKKNGLVYSSNLCDDDRPYWKDLGEDKILEIPIHWVNYDLPYFAFNYHPAFPAGQGRIANYTGVLNNWKDEFFGCHEYGLCYVLQLDPAAIGAPGRIGLLEELLDYIETFDGVWWTTGEEMYEYCLKSSQDR